MQLSPLFQRREGLTRPAQLILAKAVNAKVQSSPPVLQAPPQLSNMDYWQCLESFKRIDFNSNGSLQEDEFGGYLKSQFPAEYEFMDVPTLFSRIDKDNNGDICIEEFFAWIYCVPSRWDQPTSPKSSRSRTGGDMSPKSPMSRSLSTASISSPMSPKSPTSPGRPGSRPGTTASISSPMSPKSPASPGRPGSRPGTRSLSQSTLRRTGENLANLKILGDIPKKRLVIEFQHGADMEGSPSMPNLIGKLEQSFKECTVRKYIQVRKVKVEGRGMMRATVQLGKGIVIWDQLTMQPFREYPFKDFRDIEKYVQEMAGWHIPLLLRVMNLEGKW
jgi:hypothetical protein